MKSIFTNIQSHVNWKKTEPEENMFTSVMSAVLEKVPGFNKMLLGKVLKRKVSKEYGVLTQEHRTDSGIIPDITLVSEDGQDTILIENKLQDVLKKAQLNKYTKHIAKTLTKTRLVVISYYDQEVLDGKYNDVIRLKWWEVYEMVKKCLNKEGSKTKEYLLKEFLNYMEDNNMMPFSGLKPADINAVAISKIIYYFVSSINEAIKGDKEVKRVKRFSAVGDAEDIAGIFTGMKIKKKYTVYLSLYFMEKEVRFYITVWGADGKHIKLKKAFTNVSIGSKKITFKGNEEVSARCYESYMKLTQLVSLKDKDGQVQKEKFIKSIREIVETLKKSL